jgi:hypothetical protein
VSVFIKVSMLVLNYVVQKVLEVGCVVEITESLLTPALATYVPKHLTVQYLMKSLLTMP